MGVIAEDLNLLLCRYVYIMFNIFAKNLGKIEEKSRQEISFSGEG